MQTPIRTQWHSQKFCMGGGGGGSDFRKKSSLSTWQKKRGGDTQAPNMLGTSTQWLTHEFSGGGGGGSRWTKWWQEKKRGGEGFYFQAATTKAAWLRTPHPPSVHHCIHRTLIHWEMFYRLYFKKMNVIFTRMIQTMIQGQKKNVMMAWRRWFTRGCL